MPEVTGREARSKPVLRAEGVIALAGGTPIDLDVPPGSIIGLGGLEGHGQEEFLEILAGLRRPLSGRLVAHTATGQGREVADQHGASRAGIAYVPRDRKREGIFPSMSVLDNFGIASLSRFSHVGILSRKALTAAFDDAKERLGIVVGSEHDYITALSGGNQQKVLLARALALRPSVLLLNDPTRGVDANAKASFYRIFAQITADDGMAIIVLSTELKELVELSDRVLVFHQGGVERICEGETLDESSILSGMFGERGSSEVVS